MRRDMLTSIDELLTPVESFNVRAFQGRKIPLPQLPAVSTASATDASVHLPYRSDQIALQTARCDHVEKMDVLRGPKQPLLLLGYLAKAQGPAAVADTAVRSTLVAEACAPEKSPLCSRASRPSSIPPSADTLECYWPGYSCVSDEQLCAAGYSAAFG